MSWVDTENALHMELVRTVWADADTLEPDSLEALLRVGQAQAEAYQGYVLHGNAVPTDSQRLAAILLTRHVYATSAAGDRAQVGPDGYPVEVSTWPLVLQARALLRPKTSPLGKVR